MAGWQRTPACLACAAAASCDSLPRPSSSFLRMYARSLFVVVFASGLGGADDVGAILSCWSSCVHFAVVASATGGAAACICMTIAWYSLACACSTGCRGPPCQLHLALPPHMLACTCGVALSCSSTAQRLLHRRMCQRGCCARLQCVHTLAQRGLQGQPVWVPGRACWRAAAARAL